MKVALVALLAAAAGFGAGFFTVRALYRRDACIAGCGNAEQGSCAMRSLGSPAKAGFLDCVEQSAATCARRCD